jgi:hypothetical protein
MGTVCFGCRKTGNTGGVSSTSFTGSTSDGYREKPKHAAPMMERPMDFSHAINVGGCFLVKTSSACPEQYDVYEGKAQIGYLRLRHGEFRADYPVCGGKTVYEAEPNGDGEFDDDERYKYLALAVEVLLKVHLYENEAS